ncbi:MAG TPA: energy coupling factor transporter S component ThiW [Candidatus Desulfaltia sp.]|nr:energy coupling factor transporter S component ThiW [Candidatus Desulfaltia sp.]
MKERTLINGFWCTAPNTLRIHLAGLSEEARGVTKAPSTRRIALAAVLSALTVALSPLYIPLGATKCFPAQHMMNAVAGVLLGPWYAAAMALATGTIRNMFNLGTLYAYPGGIPGALVVGLTHRYLKKMDVAALAEPLGTVVIGATLSALLLAPALGHSMTLYFFWVAFAASSVPGSVLGYLVIKTVRRLGFDQYFHE